jgi:hypothetical protein
MSEQLFKDMIMNCDILKRKIKRYAKKNNLPINFEKCVYKYIFVYFVDYYNYPIILDRLLENKSYRNDIFSNSNRYLKMIKSLVIEKAKVLSKEEIKCYIKNLFTMK